MTDTDPVPVVGSRIGRYLIIREVAQGALGSLFIAEREVGEGVGYGLARVVSLPTELAPHDEQSMADAIWDSTHLNHELALRVADVITGKGWITLIHEHSEGSLLSYLQKCAKRSQCAFPAKVASRMALDVIEGLEQSRDLCASAGIPWRAGSVSAGSLLLGPDGRVRAMDGQITSAALRVPALRQRPGVAAHAAPELLDDTREPSERSDVFAVGALLWELLTGQTLFADQRSSESVGQAFKVPKVTQSVPTGTKVPQGLVHTVHTALEADPSRRQSSLRELAVAIVMGVEDVSTYEQVLEFTDGLLLAAASDAPAAPDQTTEGAEPTSQSLIRAASDADTKGEIAPTSGPVAGPVIFSVETPAGSVDQPPQAAATAPETAHVPEPPIAEQNQALPSAPGADSVAVDALKPEPDEVTAQRAALASPPANTEAEPSPASPNTDTNSQRAKLGTLPGHGDDVNERRVISSPVASVPTMTATEHSQPSQPVAPVAASDPTPSVPPPSTGPFRLVHDEPFVPIAVKPVQVIGDSEPSPKPAQQPSSRPPPSLAPNAPVVATSEPALLSVAPQRTIQLSLGTIVFGILTTVLAVVVVMLVIQQRSPARTAETVAPASRAVMPASERAEQQVAAAEPAVANRVPAAAAASDAGVGVTTSPVVKGDHHKHPAGTSNKPGGKASSDSDTRPSDSKPTEPPTNRHYIPNEL